MSWFRHDRAQDPSGAGTASPLRARTERQGRGAGFAASLRADVGRRLTVLWRCGPVVASTTGWVVKVDRDVVEVRGVVATFPEPISRLFRRNPDLIELSTVIPLRNVCAWMEDVPRGAHTALPLYVAPVSLAAAPWSRPRPLPVSDGGSARRGGRWGVVVDLRRKSPGKLASGA